MFLEDHVEDIEGLSHCITDYIKFCEDRVEPTKKFRCFPNNKPWINKNIKTLLIKKKRAFIAADREGTRSVQKELRRELRGRLKTAIGRGWRASRKLTVECA